jgi:uncharacterized protein
MILCIDTNTVLQALAQHHPFHPDPDDNIFTDCAITADADYVLTEDGHFSALADSGYKPRPIPPEQFIARHIASGGR